MVCSVGPFDVIVSNLIRHNQYGIYLFMYYNSGNVSRCAIINYVFLHRSRWCCTCCMCVYICICVCACGYMRHVQFYFYAKFSCRTHSRKTRKKINKSNDVKNKHFEVWTIRRGDGWMEEGWGWSKYSIWTIPCLDTRTDFDFKLNIFFFLSIIGKL